MTRISFEILASVIGRIAKGGAVKAPPFFYTDVTDYTDITGHLNCTRPAVACRYIRRRPTASRMIR
jgi:hypothetical protein